MDKERLNTIKREVADLVTKRGAWDEVCHIGYLKDLNGTCNIDGCTDLLAVYVTPTDNIPQAYLMSADDAHFTWADFEELDDDIVEEIYKQITETYGER